jgi:agmatinase
MKKAQAKNELLSLNALSELDKFNLEQLEDILPFGGSGTFMKTTATKDIQKGDFVVAGIPFDAGATFRPGTRFGPKAIRDKSHYAAAFQPVYPWQNSLRHRVIDYGDMVAMPGTGCLEMMLELGYTLANRVLDAGGRLLALGGDHTIPIGIVRAVAKKFGKISLIHLDAHQDSYPVEEFARQKIYNHGVFATQLVVEGCIDVSTSTQVYIRTNQPVSPDGGYEIIYANDALQITPEALAEKIKKRVGNTHAYLTLDIDAIDPAYAPGTGSPVPGGPSTADVRRLLHALKGINLVGADLVEVNPMYDANEITAVAAASLAIDLLQLMDTSSAW